MGNSMKRHNIEKSGVVGHLNLSGGRLSKEEECFCALKIQMSL